MALRLSGLRLLIRMEASTNLIGGQPFSLANLREVAKVAQEYGIPLVLDASLERF